MNKAKGIRALRTLRAGKYFQRHMLYETAVIELLADLRHLCDGRQWDFSDLDRKGYQRYLEENARDI